MADLAGRMLAAVQRDIAVDGTWLRLTSRHLKTPQQKPSALVAALKTAAARVARD